MLDTGEKNADFGRGNGLGIQCGCGLRQVTLLSLGFLPMGIVVRGDDDNDDDDKNNSDS